MPDCDGDAITLLRFLDVETYELVLHISTNLLLFMIKYDFLLMSNAKFTQMK
jgi:hypothetical protein